MRRLLFVWAVLLAASGPGFFNAQTVGAQSPPAYRVVSDSYYRVDPAAGTMTVRVEATFYNSQSAELKTVPLALMPGASGLVVTRDGTELKTTFVPGKTTLGQPAAATVQLPAPLKGGARFDLVATYSVSGQDNDLVHMAPGIVETPFVSQGAGSFVLVDVPRTASNYFDPGCIQLASQPADVAAAGLQRWVCGEVLRAVFGRTESTEAACAHLDDRCRQQTLRGTVIAFAQSITDSSSQATAESDVQMQTRVIHLSFKYFKRDEKWAQREMEIAKTALPRLEALFGFPFPFESLSLRESHHIEVTGTLGLAYTTGGDILVAPETGVDDEVTVHEIAHQWAGGNLAEAWEAEGLAEYAMRTLAPGLGFTPTDRGWQKMPYTDTLAMWGGGSTVTNPDYWYGKAGAFFQALEKAVGGQQNMTAVLAGLDPYRPHAPFDGRVIMDRAEAVSGANLDDLFLKWVFNPAAATDLLKQRREARNQLAPVTARAASMGLSGVPSDIQANLDSWTFTGIAGQIAQAMRVLDSYDAVTGDAADAGLAPSPAVGKSWGTDTIAHTAGVVEDERLAISAIVTASAQLAGEQPGSAPLMQLTKAKEQFAAGDLSAAKRLASDAVAAQYNGVAAGKLIELAKATQAAYQPSFYSRVGLLFLDPDGDLAAAQRAYDGGDARKALQLSRQAYDGWNGAEARGMQRLAMLAAVMAAVSVGAWILLRRVDRGGNPALATRHYIDPSRASWRDWENPR